MAPLKQYTRSEVEGSKDATTNTLIILHDKVFDVHSFLNEHPGGEEILLDHKAKDGSEDFDDVGHSKDAFELMKKYLVGEIVESDKTHKVPKKGWVAGFNSKEPEKEKYVQPPGMPFYLLITGLLLLLAAIFYVNS